jgi:hypothetical protein
MGYMSHPSRLPLSLGIFFCFSLSCFIFAVSSWSLSGRFPVKADDPLGVLSYFCHLFVPKTPERWVPWCVTRCTT